MGGEFHITRAKQWFESETTPITSEEWLAYIANDPELELAPRNGKFNATFLGQSSHAEPWLDWSAGNIYTKWPDPTLYRKMLSIAKILYAQVQDDEGTVYLNDSDWIFDITEHHTAKKFIRPKPLWWRILMRQ